MQMLQLNLLHWLLWIDLNRARNEQFVYVSNNQLLNQRISSNMIIPEAKIMFMIALF